MLTDDAIKQSISRRMQVLDRASRDSDFRALVTARCAKDIVFWLSTFVWTYDPRRTPSHIPFDPFPRQVEYLRWRQTRRRLKQHCIVEKSRDAGISYLNCAAQLHGFLFEPGYAGIMASRKEILVHRLGDPGSLFEKISMIIERLPRWMIPKYQLGYLKFINKENGATITGEAGSNVGRGSRASCLDVDEAGFLEQSEKVAAAVSQNSDCVIWTSTPNGTGNQFYRMRFSGNYPVFTLHWSHDKRKDQEWYEKQKAILDPVTVASELDIDYSASVEGIYIPAAWVRSAVDFHIPHYIGTITSGLDVATTGKNRNVLVIRRGPMCIAIHDWQGLNTTETAYTTREKMLQYKATHLNFDVDGVGAGVAGTLESTPELEFDFKPIHGAGKPSDRIWVGENKTAREKFYNQRAEAYGNLRERFRKTYEVVEGIADYTSDELISIPNHPTLIAQLSQPLRKFTSSGKILVESKDEMRKRGVESPDFADSLVLAYIDPPLDWDDAEVVGEQRVGYSIW